MATYTVEMIPALKRKAERDRRRASEHHSDCFIPRCRVASRCCRIIEFLELGAAVEDYLHLGLIIDGRYIVANQKNRWRTVEKNAWFSFKTPQQFYQEVVKA